MQERNEMYNLIRYINLLIGLFNVYLFTKGGGILLLGIGALNIAVWVFTRKSWNDAKN